MSYDNAVRHAVRTVKNPTNVDVYVTRRWDGDISLQFKNAEVMALPKVKRALFAGYLRELVDIIETHGGVRVEIRPDFHPPAGRDNG